MYDQVSLYTPHKVCKECFTLYKGVEDLKSVERKFAKALGIPIDQMDTKEEDMKSEDEASDPYEMLVKKKDQDLEELLIKELYRFRILLTFQEI
mmetsp:Transcript_551/g.596  ORF Transcript_551/g.596 Transcript_551/m.596 type:complete len:94 (+) Transcript_551:156-437(+)